MAAFELTFRNMHIKALESGASLAGVVWRFAFTVLFLLQSGWLVTRFSLAVWTIRLHQIHKWGFSCLGSQLGFIWWVSNSRRRAAEILVAMAAWWLDGCSLSVSIAVYRCFSRCFKSRPCGLSRA
jgi:hypothetical protein